MKSLILLTIRFHSQNTTELMMKFKLLLFISIFIFPEVTFSQNALLDSLKKKLKTTQADTNRIKIYNKISRKFFSISFDSTMYYAKKAEELADKTNFWMGKAEALRIYGTVYENTVKFDSAFMMYRKVIDIYKKNNDEVGLSGVYINMGTANHTRDSLDSAAFYYKKAIAIGKKLSINGALAGSYNNLGYIYQFWGNNYKALECFQNSLEAKLKMGDDVYTATTYFSLAGIYNTMKENERSLYYYDLAADIFKRNNILSRYAFAIENKGVVYSSLNRFDSAIYCYREAVLYSEKANNKCGTPLTYIQIGKAYFSLKDLDSANWYNQKAASIYKECNTDFMMIPYYALNGAIQHARGKNNAAEKSYLTAYNMADKVGRYARKKDLAKNLYSIYKDKGNFRIALKYHEIFKEISDSLSNQENIAETARLDVKYEYDKEKQKLIFEQDKQTIKLEEEKKLLTTRQTAAFVGFGVMVLMSMIIARAYHGKHKANKSLSLVNDKLQQLDQFKTRLFANINHDFRTPLTLIQGYISKIRKNENNYLTDESETDLHNLKNNTHKLIEMTEEIQDILLLEESKLKLNFSAVEISSYLNRIVSMFNSSAEQAQIEWTFESKIKSEQLSVHLDATHFEKIMYNLLSNALRYTEENGRVKVILEEESERFVLSVIDSGKGINPKFLPHIFDRFYQTPDKEYQSKEGFGIGLAVVKELVDLHGGYIEAESALNVGSTFKMKIPFNLDKKVTVELPTHEVKEVTVNIPTKEAKNSIVGKSNGDFQHTVLIVDDHDEIREYITNLIIDQYHIKKAANGQQALKILEKEEVDLILTDLMMPWLDGFGLIEKLQEDDKLKQIPVMVVSARTTEEDKHKILDKGVNDFISKPFNPEELQKRIFNVLNEKNNRSNSWDAIVKDKNTQTNLEQNILKKINQIIINRIDDPELTIDVLAEELCASRSKTIRMIKSLTGQTTLTYIKGIRLDYVSHLIKTKKIKNLSEAANAIGMTNTTQFSNQYKKHFGEAPFV